MLSGWQKRIIVCSLCMVLLTLVYLHQTTESFRIWSAGSQRVLTDARLPRPGNIAPYLSPADLISRPLAGAQGSIPKIFHQSWKTNELPNKFARWSDTCRERHPDWEWVLWTDDDNRELIRRFVPGMLEAYDGLRGPIFRADIVRNAYMYLFGGVYADLDMECLRPADELFSNFGVSTNASSEQPHSAKDGRPESIDDLSTSTPVPQKLFVGRMGSDEDFEHSIPNAWMASPPGHPFYKLVLEWATQKVTSGGELDSRPEAITGPIALRDGIQRFQAGVSAMDVLSLPDIISRETERAFDIQMSFKDASIEILSPNYIYPYSWDRDGAAFRKDCSSTASTFNAKKCKDIVAVDRWPSWTITYWSHTWNGDGPNEANLQKVEASKH